MTRRRHGTVYGQPHMEGRKVCAATFNSGCRCDGCRAAKRAQQAKDVARRQAIAAAGHPEGVPVSESTYKNWQCRCDGCRLAHLRFQRSNGYRAQRAWRARQQRAARGAAK